MQNKLRTNTTTIEAMFNDIQPNLRQYLQRDILILDILPYMLEILQPRLRQVNISYLFGLLFDRVHLDKYCSIYE
jgi:hypothetical protein